jgi:hypothetical protein
LSKRSLKPAQNPYKVLYWMGAGLLVLLLGVLALALLRKPTSRTTADPERTLIWLYDTPTGTTAAAIIEESRSLGTISAVPFTPNSEAQQYFAKEKATRTQSFLADKLGRSVHHRIFLTYAVLAKLVDAASGVTVNGQVYKGAAAVAWIKGSKEEGAQRATQVMLALPDAMALNGMNIGVSEGLSLASAVDTSFDLMSLPNVFQRWSDYGQPQVANLANSDYASVQAALKPDPVKVPDK